MSGKGSTPRPIEVPRDQYESEYERIFGKKPEPETNPYAPRGHAPHCKGQPVVYATIPPQYGVMGCTCKEVRCPAS